MTITLRELYSIPGMGSGQGDWAPVTEANVRSLAGDEVRRHGVERTGSGRCSPVAMAALGASKLLIRARQRSFDAQQRWGSKSSAAAKAKSEEAIATSYWLDLQEKLERCESVTGLRAFVVYGRGSLGASGSRRVFFVNGGQFVGNSLQDVVLAGGSINSRATPARSSTIVAGPRRDVVSPVAKTETPSAGPGDLNPVEVAERAAIRAREDAARAASGSSWLSAIPNWIFGVTDTASRFYGGSPPTPGSRESERAAGFTEAEIDRRASARAAAAPKPPGRPTPAAAPPPAVMPASGRSSALESVRRAQAALRAKSAPTAPVVTPVTTIRRPMPVAPQRRQAPREQIPLRLIEGPPSWVLPVVAVGTAAVLSWAGYVLLSGPR